MPEVSMVSECGDLCGECPVWNPDKGAIEWLDCVGGKLHELRWPLGRESATTRDLVANGFRRHKAGGYVLTNPGGIWWWDGHGGPVPIVQEVNGSVCQANDCVADQKGRLITATYYYDPAREYQRGSLVVLGTDGRLEVVDDGFDLANGLGLSPDQKTLYFADSVARRIYSFDYDIATGRVRDRRILVQVPREEGLPDGIAVDADGFIWCAQWYGGCIVQYDPDGALVQRIAIPAKQTSSLAFGGSDLTDIFVTTAAQSEEMPVMPPGYDARSGNFGGALYHVNLGIAGQKANLANIPTSAMRSEGRR